MKVNWLSIGKDWNDWIQICPIWETYKLNVIKADSKRYMTIQHVQRATVSERTTTLSVPLRADALTISELHSISLQTHRVITFLQEKSDICRYNSQT